MDSKTTINHGLQPQLQGVFSPPMENAIEFYIICELHQNQRGPFG